MRTKTDDRHGIRVLACIGAMTLAGGADELDEAVIACSKKAAAAGVIMKIAIAPAGPVRRIFELTQLERGFEIFGDVDSAALSFG